MPPEVTPDPTHSTEAAVLPAQRAAAPLISGPNTYLVAAVHDLKNQLLIVRGTAQLLQRQMRRSATVDPERILMGLAQIETGTTKMHRLVEEFFDLARVQRGDPVEFDTHPTDLVLLAQACIGEFARITDHTLSLSCSVETLVGDWDAHRLERVITNLLSNAVKYSAPDTEIVTSVTCDGPGNAGSAVLTVADRGVGIPGADLPHIFTPYYRGRNVVHETAGTGIGLFGARAIIEQHGGTLVLQSTEGVGTTVTVRLPLGG